MPICREGVQTLISYLGEYEAAEVIMLAKKTEKLEEKWKRRIDEWLDAMTSTAAKDLIKDGKLNSKKYDFETIFAEHFFDVAFESLKTTKELPIIKVGLAKGVKGKVPRTLADLQKLWDLWRNKGQVPERAKSIAEAVKKSYLERIHAAWKSYSESFRSGEEFNQKQVTKDLQSRIKKSYSYSKMVVETETTKHWNDIRRAHYSGAKSVTHFLYMAIRDFRTTEWCKTRHGLVYAKEDPELPNVAPSHWNCRSEILPLTPFNPRHKALIDDKSKARRNHRPKPLPPGWGRK